MTSYTVNKIKFCIKLSKNTFYTEGSFFRIYEQYKILFHLIKFKKNEAPINSPNYFFKH
jgi:hypothetical protein